MGTIADGKGFPDVARLMTIATTPPKYRPLVDRNAAIFTHEVDLITVIVKFFGEDLWGDVRLRIWPLTYINPEDVEDTENTAPIDVRVDCRIETPALRAAIALPPDLCRITAFPGLWEFAFARNVIDAPTIVVDPVITSAPRRFLGGAVPFREAWRSRSSGGNSFDIVKVVDSIPHLDGEVKPGAMTLGYKIGLDRFVCSNWSCPRFTFRSL